LITHKGELNMNLLLILLVPLFLIKIVSGLWLLRFRRAYPTGLLTVHKLISLATLGLLAWMTLPLLPAVSRLAAATGIVTGILFLVAIISGGLASVENLPHRPLVITHRASTALAVIMAVALLGFLLF
jgi:hypothetical protein